MARLRNMHNLKRPKIRQDWNKHTLYNLSRMETMALAQVYSKQTYFQQKWSAKSATRGYHNPYVREKAWTRMFDRRIPAVVPMSHRYLARHDGSELASGRGMGREAPPEEQGRPTPQTPYMHMAFHPLERRLDTAIWRALFASSARQARQFVVHGAVKVNGKRMIHPSYQLNPGDMFSVDPEKVLFATGAKKMKKNSPFSAQFQRKLEAKQEEQEQAREEGEREESADEDGEDFEVLRLGPDVGINDTEDPRNAMKVLLQRAKRISGESKHEMSGKRQQELREFARTVKSTLSKIPKKAEGNTKLAKDKLTFQEAYEALEKNLAEILVKIPTQQLSKDEAQKADKAAGGVDPQKARKEVKQLQEALARARAERERQEENPVDASKPYATPWEPRDYMSAFAFIPRYLEVNHNICSAVYLRHPVARPGLAEVPTPFGLQTVQLAFNWYLKRR